MHNVYETLRDFYEAECMEENIDMTLMFGEVGSVVILSCKNATRGTSVIRVFIDEARENVKELLQDELNYALLKLKEHRKAPNNG